MGLEDLVATRARKQQELAEKRAEQAKYRSLAVDIDELYNQLAEMKGVAEGYYSGFEEFSKERFDDFKGAIFNGEYEPAVNEIKREYKALVNRIDTNLDRLNRKATSYRNKADNLDGPIGWLKSSIRSLTTMIENWFN